MQHEDISHSNGVEMRISTPKLVESLARAALKNVPGSQVLLDQHFRKTEETAEIKPSKLQHQKLYDGYGTV